jgi:DNA invertase Pin-like site-specific DNA recombinase
VILDRLIIQVEEQAKSCLMKLRINNSSNIKSLINNFVLFFNYITRLRAFNKKKYDPVIESLSLKAKTRQEVADEYGITLKTLRMRLKKAKIRIPPGRLFPKTLKIIYSKFGMPGGLKTT